jgi:hypothetical protein
MVQNFRLYHTYYHAPNALVLPPSTVVGDIDNDERRLAGRDGLEGGGMTPPTLMAILVIVIIVNVGSGSVGANDWGSMPNTTEGWPADDVTTAVVGFPLVVRSPAHPLPILHVVVFVIIFVFIVVALFVK